MYCSESYSSQHNLLLYIPFLPPPPSSHLHQSCHCLFPVFSPFSTNPWQVGPSFADVGVQNRQIFFPLSLSCLLLPFPFSILCIHRLQDSVHPPSGSLYSNAYCFCAFMRYLLLLVWCYSAVLSHWSLCFKEVSNVLGRECNDSGLHSLTGLIFIYSICGLRSDSEVAPGFYC